MLKNVAATPAFFKICMTASVLVPGPSSKVRATVLPLPSAKWLTPYPAAGQGAAAWTETLGTGTRTVAGSAARTSDGGQGPAGNERDDGWGPLGASGVACAAGPV